MAINYELLNKGGISLGTNFELLSEKPLDSRLVVPSLDGLQNYIDNAAAYEGLIAYVSSEKKHYEVKVIDGVLSYRPFGLTEAELNDLITNATTAAMEFKGATATLPENPAKGDMYKVAGENINIKIDDVDAKLGDSIVYDGEKWFLIPSGDDIEDTWRPVAGVSNDATLTFEAGDKLDVAISSTGNIKYSHETVAAPADVTAEGDEKTRTYITAVETDGYGHITGYKTATENVEDTNTEYTFESQVESSSVYFNVTANTEGATEETIYVDAYSKNEAEGKFVAKEEGKSLVSDDEIARLAEVDNYDDEEVRGLIGDNAKAIEDLEKYVGTIPNVSDEEGNNKYADLDVIGYINKKAQETLAAASGNSSETAASVKQQLDDYIGENNTRVKAVEDDVAAIKDAENGILKQAKDYADGLAGNYDEAGAAAGVKSELEAEIAKKVAKTDYEADKATFATKTELGDVDKKFADYKTAADQKLVDDAQDVELGKKVDKVDGKDLIATSEIERLATLKNYDDTVLAGRVTDAEGKITALETESAKHATKDELNGVDAKFADYTKTADLPKDLGDFTNNVGYAKTADVNTELDKKADKTQVATDIANAIAPLATTEALNGVDAKFANYTNTTDMNAKFDLKADKTQVATDIASAIAPLATTEALNGVKATAEAATTVEEVDAQIDAKITALNLATTYEPIGAETRAKAYADGLITTANLDQYTTEQEVKDIVDGVIKTATSKETLDSLVELVEYIDTHSGDAINMATAIGVLEGKVEVIEEKPAYGITATQISNWDNEVGAKALAETKLNASTFTEYSNAHASDYTNKQIDDAIDADVKTAIDAEVLRANGAYDAKGDAAKAQAAAEATAAGALATARTEITAEIGTAISGEVSRADGKYEEKGVAQGIVDGLKLGETYEPIGAETRAIAAAKTETEAQVKALAGEGNTSTVKKNADDIASLFEQFQWGEF